MSSLSRRRFFSVCTLTSLSFGLAPARTFAGSGTTVGRFQALKEETVDAGSARVTLLSRGQGESFERFLPDRSKVEIALGLEPDDLADLQRDPAVGTEMSEDELERWRIHRTEAPTITLTSRPILVDASGQETDQLPVAHFAFLPREVSLDFPMYAYPNGGRAIPAMLVRLSAPSLRPIVFPMTWQNRPLDKAHEPPIRSDYIDRHFYVSRMRGSQRFNQLQQQRIFHTLQQQETLAFEFFDADEVRSPEDVGPDTLRGATPLFRASLSIRDAKFAQVAHASVPAMMEAITDIQEGRAPEYESPECYLSTAACEAVGLPDDCWELQTLRRFRDEVLPALAGGREDIERYYREAPAIVDRLRNKPHGFRHLLKLYWQTILPCALLAKIGANRLCHRLYRRRHRKLQKA